MSGLGKRIGDVLRITTDSSAYWEGRMFKKGWALDLALICFTTQIVFYFIRIDTSDKIDRWNYHAVAAPMYAFFLLAIVVSFQDAYKHQNRNNGGTLYFLALLFGAMATGLALWIQGLEIDSPWTARYGQYTFFGTLFLIMVVYLLFQTNWFAGIAAGWAGWGDSVSLNDATLDAQAIAHLTQGDGIRVNVGIQDTVGKVGGKKPKSRSQSKEPREGQPSSAKASNG